MDWIFSCFRRKQKQGNADGPLTNSTVAKASTVDRDLIPGEQHADKSHEPLLCTIPGTDAPKVSSSTCQLGKLKAELDILTRKLLQEAENAESLTEEVMYIRSCSQLLESPTAFKKALDDLENTTSLAEGVVEGKKHLLLLQSLLTKIESEGQVQKQRSFIAHGSNLPREGINKTIQELIRGDSHEQQTALLLNDSRCTNIKSKAADKTSDVELKLCNLNDPCNSIDTNLSKSQQIPATRKTRSLSFSGFFLEEEDEVNNSCASGEELIIRHEQSTKFSDSKLCTTLIDVVSSENTEDASGSLFAFTTGINTPDGQSVLSEQAISVDFSRADMFSTADSEPDYHSATSQEYISSRQKRNEKDEDFCEVYDSRLSEADSIDSKREQESSNDLSRDRHIVTVHGSDKVTVASGILRSVSSEEDKFSLEDKDNSGINDLKTKPELLRNPSLEDTAFAKTPHMDKVALLSEKMLSEEAFEQEQGPSNTTAVPRSILATSGNPKKPMVLDGEELSESKEQFALEATSDSTPESPHVISLGSSSDMFFSPPSSVDSNSMLLFPENTFKHQGCTPSRASFVSSLTTDTPNSMQKRPSPAKLAEDRPILGTVAAHWSHSSSSATQPWWDGKGIPNSTNKYKEDQKVNWHATPFEVRLERALASQGRVLQKKLFVGAMTSEMDLNIT